MIGNLDPIGIPSTESQARELAPFDPELQKAIWQIAVETAPKDAKGQPSMTAGHIKSVASVVKGIVESDKKRAATPLPLRHRPQEATEMSRRPPHC